MLNVPPPTLLIADDDPANRRFIANVLTNAGWDVAEAVDGDAAIASALQVVPDLVMMDIDMPRLDGWAATAAIRTAPPPLASVPILAYTAASLDPAELVVRGMDGHVPKPCEPDVLVAAVARWRPDGVGGGAERLAAVFGREEMTGLIVRFRDQLATALDALDDGGEVPAHRIAGGAGTLGVADVSASWLILSEPAPSVCLATIRSNARRDARIAIARIDRDWNIV